MSYRIEYDRGNGKYEIQQEKTGSFVLLLGGIVALLILTSILWQGSGEFVRGLLIPGEDPVTVQAFQNMTDDLRSGARLEEALEGFCRYVIHGS